jgi:hypothetical protein
VTDEEMEMTLKTRFEAIVAASPLADFVDNIEVSEDDVVTYRWDGMITVAMIEVDGAIFEIGDTMDHSRWNVLLNGDRHPNLESVIAILNEALV